MSIRVLLVDDHALARTGLRMVLDAEPDIEVVGEAATGRQAVAQRAPARARRRADGRPDARARRDRSDARDRRRGRGAARARPDDLRPRRVRLRALDAGASGFLLKDVAPEQLVDGIRVVAAGEALLAPSVTRRLMDEMSRGGRRAPATTEALEELTARELEMLRCWRRACRTRRSRSCSSSRRRR